MSTAKCYKVSHESTLDVFRLIAKQAERLVLAHPVAALVLAVASLLTLTMGVKAMSPPLRTALRQVLLSFQTLQLLLILLFGELSRL